MRLGFHYHIPAEERGGAVWAPGYLGRFLDSLAARVERLELFLHAPRPEERPLLDYPLQAANARLNSLGPRGSVPQRLLQAGRILAPLRERRAGMDALLIRGPSPLLPAAARAAGEVPVALLLVGDYLAGVDDLPQPRWRKEAIRAFAWWNARGQLAAARRSLTIVNSRKLYRQLEGRVPRLVETRTTTLTEADFYVREDTCQSRPARLLYTGRMDRAKGLMDILQALIGLTRAGEDLALDLVGMPEPGDPILDELQAAAAAAGLAERVRYHGYRAVGPDLFQFYRQADIFVLASRASEGFPRTIWEAMAHSLPVAATRVGSIPDFIEGAAELVAPGDPAGLERAIGGLLRDAGLRRQRIAAGLALARQNTLEAQVPRMVDEIEGWVKEHAA